MIPSAETAHTKREVQWQSKAGLSQKAALLFSSDGYLFYFALFYTPQKERGMHIKDFRFSCI
jgi:hypothetical protein